MAYVIVVSPTYGNAYRREVEGTIFATPILGDGSISLEYDDWEEVNFQELSREDRNCIQGFFENLNHL